MKIRVPCWSLYDTLVENACPHAAVGMPTPDSASPEIAMPWEISPHTARMESFSREAVFLAFLENRLCRKARSSARLELDNETDEDEIADEDDVARALDLEEVMQPNTIRMKPGDYRYHRHYGDTVDGLNVERLEDSVVGSKFL